MKSTIVSLVSVGILAFAGTAHATGTLIQLRGTDVSGTTELIYYTTGSRYTLLAGTSVNTTVSYSPYAYTSLFYLPADIATSRLVVINQAGTRQPSFKVKQVTPIGTVTSDPTDITAESTNVGGKLLSIRSADTSGTTEYVWSNIGGTYTLLGSSSVNTVAGYGRFAYNIVFYLPSYTPSSSLFVTNQAGALQTGYTTQRLLPTGTAVPASAPASSSPAPQSAPTGGLLQRALGSDASGTTEYVWNHVGSTYTLLGTGPVNATDPQVPYGYNVLFFLAKGSYVRNIVVTNQAGTVQHGVVIQGKTPAVTSAAN